MSKSDRGSSEPQAASHALILTPFGDQSLTFRITLPDGWMHETEMQLSESPENYLVTMCACYISKESLPSILIEYTCIDTEITIEDWVQLYLQLADVSHAQTMYPLRRNEARFRYVRAESEHELSVVARALKDGRRIFLIQSMSLLEQTSENLSMEQCLDSFAIINPDTVLYAEPHHELVISPQIKTCMLERWQATPLDNLPAGRIGLDLRRRQADAVCGYIRISGINGNLDLTHDEIFRHARLEVEQSGFKPNERGWQISSHHFFPRYEDIRYRTARGTFDGVSDEVWILTVLHGGLAVAVTLLTPSQDESLIDWLLNKRAFEIIIEQMEIHF